MQQAFFTKHFTPDCFETNSALASQMGLKIRVRLKWDAIPTVFERSAPHSLQASESEAGPSRKRPSSITSVLGGAEEKRKAYEKREKKRVSMRCLE